MFFARWRRHRSDRFAQAPAGVLALALVLFPGGLCAAADCPPARDPRLPPAEANLGKHKAQLLAYHDGGDYDADVTAVFADARNHVERQAGQVERPAAVLDIDETSLSNWPSMKADDFGYIPGGACPLQPNLACGFNDWIASASAKPIPGALEFFRAATAKNVAVFFITGRRDSQRPPTLRNLNDEGFQGWSGLRTRPDDDHNISVVPFKSGERKKIRDGGYTILANVGDQQSDLDPDKDADFPRCKFKVPNPFYFIP
jgi:predicted secreted acid phosphatase